MPVRPGSRALFEAVFADGERAFASVRPLPGPVLDVQSADAAARRRLKADKEPAVVPMPYGDAGCYDLETGTPGSAASAFLATAPQNPVRDGPLQAVQFCMGCTVGTWDVYGAFADAAVSMPFSALRFNSPARRLDCEEQGFIHARRCAAPRPVIWTAQLFRHGDIQLSPDEILCTFWMTLAQGSRGVTAYLWKSGSGYTGMEDNPQLRQTWLEIAGTLRKRRGILFPLIPAESFDSEDGRLKIRTAWNPGKGMLVFWRTADAAPLADAAAFAVHVPEWIKAGKVFALPEGRPVSPSLSAVQPLQATAGKSYGVFWIESSATR